MATYLGFDMGGTTIKYGLVDPEGHITERNAIPTAKDKNEIVQDMIDVVKNYQAKHDLTAIGISVPGVVQNGGYLATAGAIRSLSHLNLREEIENATGIHTIAENDANAATIAEQWQGAAVGHHNYVCIVVGTGIGGGVVINDQVYHGAHGMAGEFGMMTLHHTDEPVAGSLSYTGATVTGLVDHYNRSRQLMNLPTVDDARTIYQNADDGDQLAKVCLDGFYTSLGRGISNVIVSLDPEIVIIGGGISANDRFIKELNAAVNKFKAADTDYWSLEFPKIVPAKLKNDAGIIGAVYPLIVE